MTGEEHPEEGEHTEAGRIDEESAWAAIVAGYGDRVLGDPADDDQDPTDEDPSGRTGTAPAPDEKGPAAPPSLSVFDRPSYDARSAWRHEAESGAGAQPREHDESADHYVPPEAPPLPRPRGVRGVAWVGVTAVPLLFLVLTLLDVRLVSGAGLLLLLWFVAGFGYLIGTMRDEPGDGWDDGARV